MSMMKLDWRINITGSKMAKVIAVDLGGTNLRVSLVQNNKIIKYMKDKTPKTQKELRKFIV